MRYLVWTIVALAAYTIFPPLVSSASQEIPTNIVTLVATGMLAMGALLVTLRQEPEIFSYLTGSRAPSMYLAGFSLTVGILAYYRALADGPVSVVVPVFGMFVVTSSLLSVIVLNEPFSIRKGVGIVFAAIAIYLIAS